ncbi:hypothetical protein [Amycolatopsis sp. WQ 127309]|uniref:hypothetical protein n=1 Tax=Amycolatopsis sp. WQ 127309 TaxID=2932773 RepID=UPI001FF5C0BB|nr:hypothetical protein [Amycolatopsis sp. WQ 127309]UOZ10203.1 hypothetical protein MUY22_18850 [Amycolatopsis sp. WQ 127309]
MNTLLVAYDLNRPGQNYEELIKFLKAEGTWWHCLDSTWMVRTSKSTAQLRDEIKRLVDANDEVLVMNVTGDGWASFGLSAEATDWLQKNL